MKTLLLMRHAKSSWDDKVDDRARTLSKRGRKNAARMGDLLKDEKIIPDLILASNAVRTRQTAEIVMDEMKYKGDLCFLNKLYMAEIEVYVQEIQRVTDDVDTLLLIGHSPTLDSLMMLLTQKVESLPTGSVVHLTLPIDSWKDFKTDLPAELLHFWKPKEL